MSSEKLVNHIMPWKTGVNKLDTSPISFDQYRQSSLCEVLMLDVTEKCFNRDRKEQNFSYKTTQKFECSS